MICARFQFSRYMEYLPNHNFQLTNVNKKSG